VAVYAFKSHLIHIESRQMRKRTLTSLLVALAVLVALGVALYLRAKAPPEAARLLPESDAIIYIHLKEIRSATHFDETPVKRSPEFQQFIDATGIVPERDLDSVAFALHAMPDPRGPNGPVAYSEVFIGHFDGEKLAHYLAGISSGQESYAGHTIYTIPVGEPAGRVLRVAQVGYDTIAASNMPAVEQIHSMLDRARASALGTPGSSLLAARYHDVPLLSQAWGIGHIGLPFAAERRKPSDPLGGITVMGLELPLPADTDLVASLRYSGTAHLLSGGAVELKVEDIAPDALTAQSIAEMLTSLLGVMRGISVDHPARTAGDVAMRSVLESIKITQTKDRAELTANASMEQLKALASSHNPASELQETPAASSASK
jgi:hypothetical protein